MGFNTTRLADDRMPALELVIPWRSGEILAMIREQIALAVAGKPCWSKRRMDLMVEKLQEAEAREQAVIDHIEARVQAEHRQEARTHVHGRDRSQIQREDGTRP